MSMTILVTGATGTVGSELVRALADRFEIEIRAAVRALPGKLASEGATPVERDFARPDTFAAAPRGVAKVFLLDHAPTWRSR